MSWQGTVVSIHIVPEASAPMVEISAGEAITGKGLAGDRYALERGFYSDHPGPLREVSLIEEETLEALARDHNMTLAPGITRRNIVTRGVPLNHLVGRRFRVGDVILRGGRLNFPCKYLEELLCKPLFLPLYNRSGLNYGNERSGVSRPGDALEGLTRRPRAG